MKFKDRKLYSHGQNNGIFLLSLPKVICDDMGLTKDTLICIDYVDNKVIISKQEEEEGLPDQGPEEDA